MADASRTTTDDEAPSELDDLDELLQDLAFEAANRLDWVTIVRQGFPALSEEQEQTLKDMGEAFAADQVVQREWDGPAPTDDDHRWVAEVVERLAPRYELDVPAPVTTLLGRWSGPVRREPRRYGRRR
ncbi:MAG: hypothetical protein AVDCRST_MAG77-960 [uncultured Chloroflexi bacterium]|uniref:Uncharacterized protein n=1 Tax=uncultured Chloroflexota bacterium TaxID=166587 RepID=A0A6J4HIU6_9CHLR|nr:MAG: hypothetical protein AVDCRST_MAG77-960 [uncultured Chloroflexota bacterium]